LRPDENPCEECTRARGKNPECVLASGTTASDGEGKGADGDGKEQVLILRSSRETVPSILESDPYVLRAADARSSRPAVAAVSASSRSRATTTGSDDGEAGVVP
jgi:hypothetical protein